MLNKCTIMGRLTKSPELRHTQSGKSVASFSIACDRDFERGTADFFDVVAWGNTADFVSSYFSKGRMAVISGRLQTRDWKDREGNKRKVTEIVADNVYFGDSKRESDSKEPETPVEHHTEFAEIEDDGKLPF